MAMIEAILQELDREADSTRRVLQRIPEGQLAWKPHEKSRTLAQLAWHVATIPKRIATAAQSDDVDVMRFPPQAVPESAAAILEAFERQIPETRALLAGLDDAALARKVTMRRGDTKIFSGPKALFLRFVMLNHGYHHRGQLTVYLRLLGIPVPAVYGPSADEA